MYFLQCFDGKESGYIFRGMPESHIKSLFFYTVPNEALALRNHFAMMPFIFLMQKDCPALQGVEFDQDVSPLKSIVWLWNKCYRTAFFKNSLSTKN